MSAAAWMTVAMAAWIGIGAVEAMVLGRRGFDGFSWFLIGMVLGPLSVLVAWNSARRDERLLPVVLAEPTAHRTGGVDVLIGFDSSPESRAAADGVAGMLGDRLGRVALVAVGHYDDPPVHERELRAAVETEAQRLAALAPEVMIVRGHPATALAAAAVDGGYSLIVIGSTGKGHAHVFGSTAKELAHSSPVPVLLGGQHAPADLDLVP